MPEELTISYNGVLEAYNDIGTNEYHWAMLKDDVEDPFDAIVFIGLGDVLSIYDHDGSTKLFEGKIIPDYKSGWRKRHTADKAGVIEAMGQRVCWTQKGWTPDDWAGLFLRMEFDNPLRVELKRKFVKHDGFLGTSFDKETLTRLWLLLKENEEPSEMSRAIDFGDILTVYDGYKKIFECEIMTEPKTSRKYGLCWTQKGFDLDVWASFFIRPIGAKPLRAELMQVPD